MAARSLFVAPAALALTVIACSSEVGTSEGSSSTSEAVSSCAAVYYQCGGQGWTGATCCVSSTCTYQNPYYSQCVPGGSGSSSSSSGGSSGSSSGGTSPSTDTVQRAAATAALNVMTHWESSRGTTDLNDFALLDAHCYKVSGSVIVFDPSSPAGWFLNQSAVAALATAQMDPSVASYLVSGLQSCFNDTKGTEAYLINAAAFRGWSYTTTAQNVTLGTTIGTNNVKRVGASVNGNEQITLTETVNANSEDKNFGLVSTLPYSTLDPSWSINTGAKFHGSSSSPCSPFNGPGGATNPYLIVSVNGGSVGARQIVPVTDCPYANHCVSTAVVDPIPYAVSGSYYNTSGVLIGPQANPFALSITNLYADPSHAGQWATRTVNGVQHWGTFSLPVSVLGTTVYEYVQQI